MRDKVFSKKEFIASVTENVKTMYRKTLKEATQQEIYQAVSLAVKDVVMDEWMATQQVIEKDDPKILYYMSMEFLMGRALGNNLINLGAYGEVKEALEEIGLDLSVIEDCSQIGINVFNADFSQNRSQAGKDGRAKRVEEPAPAFFPGILRRGFLFRDHQVGSRADQHHAQKFQWADALMQEEKSEKNGEDGT